MIRELTVYRCICSKCSHSWVTKDHALPARCARCNVKTWNDDFDFSKAQIDAPQMDAIRQAETAQPSQLIPDEPKDALAAFIAKAQAKKGIVPEPITIEAEPMDEWIGWGKEEQTYDDQTGEMRTFRRHIKTGRVKWIDSETALISV